MRRNKILNQIKSVVKEIEPDAEIILYGSRARHEETAESDWDLLILLEGTVTDERRDRIRHRLYDIEWECGEVICSVICNRSTWNSPIYQVMPFHHNIEKDGIVL
jgi:predicted nucleotidyltransferase